MALTLIVSDLHLGTGRDPQSGKFSPLDDFYADSAFSRLLTYYYPDSPGAHLVLNGDSFDLSQVLQLPGPEELPAIIGQAQLDRDRSLYGLAHSPAETCWKLSRIAQGHATLFKAFAEWIVLGNHIHLVIGNHDPELRFKAVQEHLLRLIARAHPSLDEMTAQPYLHFHDWYLLQPEQSLYVEHGGQYEPMAYIEGSKMPSCYYNNRYLFNFLELRTPEADNIFPFSRYLAWLLSTDTLPTLAIVIRQLPDFVRARSTADEVLPPPTPPSPRLPSEVEEAICQARTRQHRHFRRVAWRTSLFTVVAIVLNIFSYLCPLFTILLVLANHLGLAVLTLLAWPLSRLASQSIITHYLHRSFIVESNFLQEATAQFAPLLAAHDIRNVAFGHTHQADTALLGDNVRYFNTSTWVPIFSDDTRLNKHAQSYFFVEVRDGQGRLLRWNDEIGEPDDPVIIDRSRPKELYAARHRR